MNGSIIHHHENSNDKINAGIRVREKHSQYCFVGKSRELISL